MTMQLLTPEMLWFSSFALVVAALSFYATRTARNVVRDLPSGLRADLRAIAAWRHVLRAFVIVLAISLLSVGLAKPQ